MYLKVTDAHLATACMVPTVQKVVSNVVPDMAVMPWAVNRRLLDSSKTEAVSNPILSETVAHLIYGWDNMCPEERAVLTAPLWTNRYDVQNEP